MKSAQTKTLLISSGNGPGECQQAVGHLLTKITEDADACGVDISLTERIGRSGPTSAIVILDGDDADRLASEWSGVVLWRCQSALRPGHRRKNWFVQVVPLPSTSSVVEINPSDVQMQAIRAGGPGGQHVNKTSSAIRAQWTDKDGKTYSVKVRDHRSQHQNRRAAIARLQTLAASDALEAEADRKGTTRAHHHQLERGSPSRVFEGASFKPI